MKKIIIPFDDYNHRLHPGAEFVGTVLPTWGNFALTNGWKIIEIEIYMAKHYKIRKLTPTECLRLMGVSDEDIKKMQGAGISDSQLYKMAGNSIVVQVLEGICANMHFDEKPLRVFEAFAGYGSQSMALRNIGVEHEVVGISEIDKYAIMGYDATHPETKNYGDICAIDWEEVPDFDFFTYSFPCTDISNAGAQAGFEEGSGTRSSLLWECRKAIVAKRPKYLLMENVKAITSKKFLPGLHRWMQFLSEQGYTNFVKVLNAKDYGVPQNRERCFLVSILGEAWYEFPQPVPLKHKLKDLLEPEVSEKYYLDQARADAFIAGLSDEKRAALEEGRTV
jgi:site-specific DNA-cytosine methylase